MRTVALGVPLFALAPGSLWLTADLEEVTVTVDCEQLGAFVRIVNGESGEVTYGLDLPGEEYEVAIAAGGVEEAYVPLVEDAPETVVVTRGGARRSEVVTLDCVEAGVPVPVPVDAAPSTAPGPAAPVAPVPTVPLPASSATAPATPFVVRQTAPAVPVDVPAPVAPVEPPPPAPARPLLDIDLGGGAPLDDVAVFDLPVTSMPVSEAAVRAAPPVISMPVSEAATPSAAPRTSMAVTGAPLDTQASAAAWTLAAGAGLWATARHARRRALLALVVAGQVRFVARSR